LVCQWRPFLSTYTLIFGRRWMGFLGTTFTFSRPEDGASRAREAQGEFVVGRTHLGNAGTRRQRRVPAGCRPS
jgi:hypothetical protein